LNIAALFYFSDPFAAFNNLIVLSFEEEGREFLGQLLRLLEIGVGGAVR
jgi:hypothetical protein